VELNITRFISGWC